MVSIRASLGLTAAILALASVSACSKKPAEDTSASAPTETAAVDNAATPAAANGAPPAANAKVAADNTDTLAGVKLASYKGDAAAGEKDVAICKTCHAFEAGKNMVGPSLHGVVGRAAGTVAGFTYSAANKGSGIVWSEDKLFQYLEAPQRIVPGTKMTYTGLKDPQKRADVIAYLKTQS